MSNPSYNPNYPDPSFNPNYNPNYNPAAPLPGDAPPSYAQIKGLLECFFRKILINLKEVNQ